VWAREPISGKRNRLLSSNAFSESDWSKTNSNVVAVADGWKLQDSGTGGSNTVLIRQIYTALPGTNTFSIEAKQDQLDQLAIRAFSFDSDDTSFFSLSAGTVLSEGASHTSSIESLDDGWYRASVEFSTTSDVSGLFYIYAASNLVVVQDLDSTSSILIRHAQGEAGSLSAFQTTTNEYDTVQEGERSLTYLSFDGVDDELSNASFDIQSSNWSAVMAVAAVSSFELSFANANIALSSNTFFSTVNNTSTNAQSYQSVVLASQLVSETLVLSDRESYTAYETGEYANTSAELKISGGGKLYNLQAYSSSLNGASLGAARNEAISAAGDQV
jgi:hypothetical protein